MNTYLLLKSLHILGIILFLGNIIITGWWKYRADCTKNPQIVAFAQRQVTLTDFIFTAGGAALVGVTGIGNAELHNMDYHSIYWLVWGYGLFVASGIIWVVILLPVQIKQARMAHAFSISNNIPESYWRLSKIWFIFGIIATILPLLNLYFMVIKPT
ncbi:MAG: DUF2269 domain-containing protein [Cocleimonas sp.]|nr:DUF2269 domain-containing protein [Cocleimonas sp.]